MTLDYVLFDMNTVRSRGLIHSALTVGREKVNKDDVSSFTWITLEELASSGAILAIDLKLPTGLAIATPSWYRRKCDAISAAWWAKQLTLEEATSELDFWHEVCWSLPWPHGWTQGRIRTAT